MIRVKMKIANTNPKNLTHPSLVKMSYLYLGTPPLIRIKKDRHAASFVVKAKENSVE
jgi:DNA gyrase/topoisomerase IV subunit B